MNATRYVFLISFVCFLCSFSSSLYARDPMGRSSSLQNLPPSEFAFERNAGQIVDNTGRSRPDILYTARAEGVNIYLSATGIHYVFSHVEPLEGYRDGRMISHREVDTNLYVLRMHRVDM